MKFFLFLFIFIFSSHAASECGLSGTIENRIEDCNSTHNGSFQLATKIGNKEFWHDKRSNLTWHSPLMISGADGHYDVISKKCIRPYRLPTRTQLKGLMQTKTLPFKILASRFIIKNRNTLRKNKRKNLVKGVYTFTHYFDYSSKKIAKNNLDYSSEYQLLCVADLNGMYLFERSR